ncbi:hypothetical protein [Eisenibacter elegans]|jgi:hypothetical protein|uniref:hypothetical protein n=1 Tax=Eisenibacter elegans TaxID=997 RepID=UPI0004165F5A|nr:hypothetical protein [Eisenibacter elegans]
MFVHFEEMPAEARVWIYQANRHLTTEEQAHIATQARAFTEKWDSHQRPLKASYKLMYDTFLLLSVDETLHNASGCSIDKSVALLKSLEQDLAISFFDRMLLAYWQDECVNFVSMANIKDAISAGRITPDTLIFNNTIQTVGELRTQWLQSAQDSWLKRFFSSQTATAS